jgi:adenine deaminase
VKHTEVFFDPQAHTDRGIAFDTVHDGIVRALQAAPQLGFTAQLIMSFRHLSPESAMAMLEQAISTQSWSGPGVGY